ncbi:MAG: hypothetical protein R2783_05395 [Gelidibacter sp.]
MKNICFVANYFKTDIFVAIAKTLDKHDINSYWIIPSGKQYKELGKTFSKDRLLYIGKKEVLATTGRIMDHDLKIHELVYGDRVLREESKKWTFDYLLKLQPLFYDFIQKNHIHHIFGEITWAHELLAQRLVRQATELKCQYYSTQTVRIPNGRFTFFTDDFESQIEEVEPEPKEQHPPIELAKPTYLAIMDQHIKNQSSTKGNLKKLKNFIFRTNQDFNDPTLYSNPYTLFKIRTKEIWNRIAFKNFVSETTYDQLPKDKKFILFTLHKQPEASIDVCGRYYENQLQLITNIWRILPEGYIFLVKEHSNAIGDRGLKFYKTVKGLRNTILIHHKEDSHRLIDLCDAVFTVSGTIAYETALKGKRSFTFAPAFFNRLSNCNEISWKDFRNSQSLFDLIHAKEPSNIEEFSNWLLNNSFEGIMTDAFTEPVCAEKENIVKLCVGFLNVIND